MHEPGDSGKKVLKCMSRVEKRIYKCKNGDEYENRTDTGRDF